ncbi:hypothetical protein LY78DRAFT_727720, partial [Colletotrichum sublineola]
PRDPNVHSERLSATLKALQHPTGPYIHSREISWKGTLPDADDRDLIGDFLKGTHGNKKCWTGLFSGPAQNWVGTGNEWKGRDWHCFAAMIVPNTVRGKNLRIYNNDAKQDVIPSSRISSVLWGLERTLWTEVQKRGNYVIWYSTDRPHAGTGKCFPHCFLFRSF